MPTAYRLRSATDDDLPFLRRVYAGTRAEEMAASGWPPEQIEAFLDMQFRAQHAHYHEHFADASFDLVLLDDEPVGRLYVHRRDDEIRIVDIALLPEHRRQGIGSDLLAAILGEARSKDLPVRIHVEKSNPALSLYRRLGFRSIQDVGVYDLMECRP